MNNGNYRPGTGFRSFRAIISSSPPTPTRKLLLFFHFTVTLNEMGHFAQTHTVGNGRSEFKYLEFNTRKPPAGSHTVRINLLASVIYSISISRFWFMMTVNLGSNCPLSGDFWCLQHLTSFQGRSKDLKKKKKPAQFCLCVFPSHSE